MGTKTTTIVSSSSCDATGKFQVISPIFLKIFIGTKRPLFRVALPFVGVGEISSFTTFSFI